MNIKLINVLTPLYEKWLLEQNPDKINWESLSENPNAIDILEKNPDKINWINLLKNENAIDLLENNDFINKCYNQELPYVDYTERQLNGHGDYIFMSISSNKNQLLWKDNSYILK
jgi:hypothetical protein